MKSYKVLKSFVFHNNGVEYEAGEFLCTDEKVNGLVKRGILRLCDPCDPCCCVPCPPCDPCDPQIPQDCRLDDTPLAKKISNSPKWDPDTKIPIPEDLDLPSVNFGKYYPQAVLMDSDKKLKEKINQANQALEASVFREARQTEMSQAMTELVNEVQKTSKNTRTKKRSPKNLKTE